MQVDNQHLVFKIIKSKVKPIVIANFDTHFDSIVKDLNGSPRMQLLFNELKTEFLKVYTAGVTHAVLQQITDDINKAKQK